MGIYEYGVRYYEVLQRIPSQQPGYAKCRIWKIPSTSREAEMIIDPPAPGSLVKLGSRPVSVPAIVDY